jgi:hypothetical protein
MWYISLLQMGVSSHYEPAMVLCSGPKEELDIFLIRSARKKIETYAISISKSGTKWTFKET